MRRIARSGREAGDPHDLAESGPGRRFGQQGGADEMGQDRPHEPHDDGGNRAADQSHRPQKKSAAETRGRTRDQNHAQGLPHGSSSFSTSS